MQEKKESCGNVGAFVGDGAGGRAGGVASGENSYELLFHGCGGGATGDPGEERTARTRRGEAWLCPEGGRKGEKEEGKQ